MKFIKTFLVVVFAVALSSCGFFDRYVVANVTGYSKSCVDGVSYLQFASGATVQYNKEGHVVTCD